MEDKKGGRGEICEYINCLYQQEIRGTELK